MNAKELQIENERLKRSLSEVQQELSQRQQETARANQELAQARAVIEQCQQAVGIHDSPQHTVWLASRTGRIGDGLCIANEVLGVKVESHPHRRYFDQDARVSPLVILPSASLNDVGVPNNMISQLNTWPACTPTNASPSQLPVMAHGSGPG